jgi:hypothetical protein
MYISIVGAVVVVTGLYIVVWGKSTEQKAMMSDESPQELSQQGQQLPITISQQHQQPQSVIIEDQTSTEKQ